MPSKWTEVAERDLLLAAIAESDFKPSTATWERVALHLGGDLTASAVSQKFYKLKKESEAILASSSTVPSTPTEKKARTPKSTGTKNKRKKGDEAEGTDAATDDTPVKVKKPKKEATEKKLKAEADDDTVKIDDEDGKADDDVQVD